MRASWSATSGCCWLRSISSDRQLGTSRRRLRRPPLPQQRRRTPANSRTLRRASPIACGTGSASRVNALFHGKIVLPAVDPEAHGCRRLANGGGACSCPVRNGISGSRSRSGRASILLEQNLRFAVARLRIGASEPSALHCGRPPVGAAVAPPGVGDGSLTRDRLARDTPIVPSLVFPPASSAHAHRHSDETRFGSRRLASRPKHAPNPEPRALRTVEKTNRPLGTAATMHSQGAITGTVRPAAGSPRQASMRMLARGSQVGAAGLAPLRSTPRWLAHTLEQRLGAPRRQKGSDPFPQPTTLGRRPAALASAPGRPVASIVPSLVFGGAALHFRLPLHRARHAVRPLSGFCSSKIPTSG
jgi:hypothetical protein